MSIIPTPTNTAEPGDIIAGVTVYIVLANSPDTRMRGYKVTRRYMLHKSYPETGQDDGRHVFELHGTKMFADEFNLERGSRKNKKARKHAWVFVDKEEAEKFYALVLSLAKAIEGEKYSNEFIKISHKD